MIILLQKQGLSFLSSVISEEMQNIYHKNQQIATGFALACRRRS